MSAQPAKPRDRTLRYAMSKRFNLYKNSQVAIAEKDKELAPLHARLVASQQLSAQTADMATELRALAPGGIDAAFSQGVEIDTDGNRHAVIQLLIRSDKPFAAADRTRIEEWYRVRTKSETACVVFENMRAPDTAHQ